MKYIILTTNIYNFVNEQNYLNVSKQTVCKNMLDLIKT